jgi:tRNA(Ile2) C34 agmatinyltransferase TiaS
MERVQYEDALQAAGEAGVQILLNGQGLIGAVAALPFCARPDESIVPGMQ